MGGIKRKGRTTRIAEKRYMDSNNHCLKSGHRPTTRKKKLSKKKTSGGGKNTTAYKWEIGLNEKAREKLSRSFAARMETICIFGGRTPQKS